MKNLHIKKRRNSPSPESLDIFEKENNVKLPDQYRNFLLGQNPYTIEENEFKRAGRRYEVHHFYPFDIDFELSLQRAYTHLNSFFENKYIAFADDSGGWQYVLCISQDDYGKVFFCRMDEELPKALTFLANSFDEFIDGLEKGEDSV